MRNALRLGLLLVCVLMMLLASGPAGSQSDGHSDPSQSAPDSNSFPVRKILTASGRVRLERHLIWVIEASEAMNGSVIGPRGETLHKGSVATYMVQRNLRMTAPELAFSIMVFRGDDEPEAMGVRLNKPSDFEAASQWLSDVHFEGGANLYNALYRAGEQRPAAVLLVVGGMPSRPAECPEGAEVMQWIVDQLRAGPGVVPVHVLGIGLDPQAAGAYDRLARITGGSYTQAYAR